MNTQTNPTLHSRQPEPLPIVVDRLIFHQFDPHVPVPGGIDTCLRGFCTYSDPSQRLAFVGVNATPHKRSRVGRWELYEFAGRKIFFLPVASFDPADQRRRVPHSLRLVLGAFQHRRRLPRARIVQAHRMDVAAALLALRRRPLAYFVHSQEGGISSSSSDSIWRFVSGLHSSLERTVIRRARQVTVFNPQYASAARELNPNARSSPTWFDPRYIDGETATDRQEHTILWVGRLERPKDPLLALAAFAELAARAEPDWRLTMVGSGSLKEEVERFRASLPETVADRVRLIGRLPPQSVGDEMRTSGILLMTSFAGYEGFPRVLVEGMASGLRPIVTEGTDTGSLLTPVTGLVCSRSPTALAQAMLRSTHLDRQVVVDSVAGLRADTMVPSLLALPRRS